MSDHEPSVISSGTTIDTAMNRQADQLNLLVALEGFRAACSCGWVSEAVQPERHAHRSSKAHAKSKANEPKQEARRVLLKELAEAATANVTPQQVIDALRSHVGNHHGLSAIAWEHGTTGIVVLSGDSTAAIRYVLSADLNFVLVAERCRPIS